ncbi:MAG: nucleoside-diphosphate kinase [Methylacidiphilales bacterium]|nr:nucleoside-diphosphate kinase [Candidatus Methylacidiphilales bacterium]
MEKTLILLKPDCMAGGHCGEVINRFEKAGFKIRACKMMRLGDAVLKEHYAHITSLPFFPQIQAFMQSSPVIGLVLEGEQIIEKVRKMLGPTDSTKAPKGSIRGDLGKTVMMNVVHASDSAENALLEIQRFFSPAELFE